MRRAQILDAALRVFAEKGFARATNKEIAHAAGIQSPGLIYHYFDDKADLLRSVLETYAPPLQLAADPRALMDLPLETGLRAFATRYIQIAADPRLCSMMRLVLGEVLRDRQIAQHMGEAAPLRIWRLTSRFLSAKIQSGDIRRVDPDLTAWSFLGGLFAYVLVAAVIELDKELVNSREKFIDQHVAMFVRGLVTAQPEQTDA